MKYIFPLFKGLMILQQWFRWHEPRHDKPNKMCVPQAKTQISLGICPVWSESSLCTLWVAKDSMFLHANSENSDQTGRMPMLIWVFAGRTLILLVLSCPSSFNFLTCVGNVLLLDWSWSSLNSLRCLEPPQLTRQTCWKIPPLKIRIYSKEKRMFEQQNLDQNSLRTFEAKNVF